MFGQRLVTALLLIPLVVLGVLWLPTDYFRWVVGGLVLLGALEWARLSGVVSPAAQGAFAGVLALGLVAGTWVLARGTWLPWVFGLVGAWWLASAEYLLRRRGAVPPVLPPAPSYLQLAAGALILASTWLSLCYLHGGQGGPQTVLYLLVLVWVADSAAFLVGRRWGRRKLAPGLSPGKTWEGVYGALAGGLACGVLWSLARDYGPGELLAFSALGLVVILFSIVGDLFESLMKRLRGVKDSGHLLPGHGGVLDRIDSLTAAAPVFALGALLLGTSA